MKNLKFKLQAGRGAEEGAVCEGPARARLLRPGGTVANRDTVVGKLECRRTLGRG